MRVSLILLVALFGLCLADKWALIAAGSKGWGNYRHQAGASHAYDMLTKKGGFPADHVIIMMEDDIAYNSANPKQGNIIHQPSGPNVYPGSDKIDYKGEDVTAENFLSILKGDKEAMAGKGSGRVIESGPDDEVMVYYVDHGNDYIVGFPHGGVLYSDELMSTLNKMYSDGKFKQMLFYLGACHSGSMFERVLAPNKSIIALTASNPHESGYACYFDMERLCYLASEFSAVWTQYSDKADFQSDTVADQYQTIVSKVTGSHPQIYGDMSLKQKVLGVWQSYRQSANAESADIKITDTIPEEDVYAETMKQLLDAGRISVDEWYNEMSAMLKSKRVFASLAEKLMPQGQNEGELDYPCFKSAFKGIEEVCGQTHQESLRYVNVIADLCKAGVTASEIVETAETLC
eukprot:gnl/Trimastix_PCT/164.p1 GENE.gnl/Trimastix_PCT/164~~gnl/Trimastix_PCT/164.p1  ORF type:complete len:404 (-),score=155.89 gnl/Trimastix_PCT/164:121-1332(-)